MFNPLFNGNSGNLSNALALIDGHHQFLLNNTGETDDGSVQHYVLNPQGVISNNRHFTSFCRMEDQPNGDATTEGQALLVIGFAYAYLATKNTKYLDSAKLYWDSYVTYFYAGQAVPTTPERWISNWLVNGKEPVLGDAPLNATEPTHSGYKGVEVAFTNGLAQLAHGSPTYGEYLDFATYAFVGTLAWDAVNADVQALNSDGSTDWSTAGTQYDVDWIIAWTGDKIDSDGNVLASGFTGTDIGTVQLKDTTVTGTYKFNYAGVNSVADGGYMVERNVVQHNRPLHVTLPGDVDQMGNASDAEQWWGDACYLMWVITGDVKYKNAMNACLFTVDEYTDIDSTDMFFRQSTAAATPFTDGISYDFIYPSGTAVTYSRTTDGYIQEDIAVAAQNSLEQQAIWFRVGATSKIRTTFGGVGTSGTPVSCAVQISMAAEKGADVTGVIYGVTLPPSTSDTPVVYDTALTSFARLTKDDGTDYIVADQRAVSPYSGCTVAQVFANGILGIRSAMTIQATFPNDDAGLDVGFWLLDSEKAPITNIVYASNGEFDLRFEDDNGWRWYWLLPATAGVFTSFALLPANLILSGYQPNHPSDPKPTSPAYSQIEEFSILLENSGDTNLVFSYYCINDIPPVYTATDGYTLRYRITLTGTEAFTGIVGDCTVVNFRDDSLAYTPGVIPFSNIYESGSTEIGAWHGMPYPGYQYPWVYTLDAADNATQLGNMVDFLYDAQQWYFTQFGQIGPVASAYIWNRWDNYKYGTPDTWTMYNWGDQDAWSGYQPRAFFGACRAWQELVIRGKTVPTKLVTYVQNWISWLVTFVKNSGGITPTEFPMTSLPVPVADDFTGHMTGLWLAGTCTAYMAGCRVDGIRDLIEACYDELYNNYVNTGVAGQPMNGSWSPAVRLGTDNGMFYGFWAGEILRGISCYIMYRTLAVGEAMYVVPS